MVLETVMSAAAPSMMSALPGLGSVGNFLSAAGGLFGSKGKRGPDLRDMMSAQLEMNEEGIQHLVRGYKKAGLHPGLAAGANPMALGGVNVGGDGPSVGDRVAAMGQGISRAVAANQEVNGRLQNRLLLSQIEGNEIENMAKASVLSTSLNSAGLPPPQQDVVTVPKEIVAHMGDIEKGVSPAFQSIRMGNKNVTVPSQAVADLDSEVLNALLTAGVTVPSMFRGSLENLNTFIRLRGRNAVNVSRSRYPKRFVKVGKPQWKNLLTR